MSSVLRFYPRIPGPATKFFDILSPGYTENVIVAGYDLPIPFIVNNQVLDINIKQSTDVENFVNGGDTPGNAINFQGKVMGGASLIKSFGPSMTTWLRNRITNEEGLASQYTGPLNLYVQPFMTRIQIAAPAQGVSPLNDEAVYGITTEAPTSPEYVGGDVTNDFFACWVFRTPMTVQYIDATGTPKYLTMTSQFSAN